MPIPSRVLLLRHGQTTWNAERRWQGWADAPLSALGEQQAIDAGAHLVGFGFTRVGASDLGRARRTAELLAMAIGVRADPLIDADLRERNVGVFSGRTTDELFDDYAECFDPVTRRAISIPDAEPDDHLWERARSSLVGMAERHPDDRLVVVSHGGLIASVERHLGIERSGAVPNLGGRWLDVVDGGLVGGEAYRPDETELVTAPATE